MMQNINVIAIVGPTGTGKSSLADALAAARGGELVSADSMQVYRGMDIGTAKIAPSARKVPYHCLDLVQPDEPFTAALYQSAARSAIREISARGHLPVVCGGTGLYLRAALDDFIFDQQRADESSADRVAFKQDGAVSELRLQLQAEADLLGARAFYAKLVAADAASAALIHPHNVRRVVRAFELLRQGSSYAEQSAHFSAYQEYFASTYLGIAVQPELLYQILNARVETMMTDGLLEEVQGLLAQGLRQAITAKQAIGYKELVAYLDGELGLAEAIEQIKQATRRYAKRQRTWFTRDVRIRWIDANELYRQYVAGKLDSAALTEQLLARAQGLLE